MKDNALIKLLQTFSRKEIKELRQFLNSPYFNKRQGAVRLFDILSEHHPDFDAGNVSKEKIFKKLFPGKKYNDGTLRVLTHYLMELTEKYIAFSRFEKNKMEFSYQLEGELYERKQYKLLEKHMSRSYKLIEELDLDAEEYFFYRYRFENARVYYLYASNYALFDRIINKSDWESVFKELTNFYVFRSMMMYLNTMNMQHMYNKNFISESFRDVFSKINISEFEDVPVIKLYYYIIKMLTEAGDESHFYKVKEYFQKNKALFNKFEIIGVFVNLENYCLRKISAGYPEFEKELFNIFKEELEDKTTYLTGDGYMSPLFYRNVVTSGLALKEFSWVKNFINKFKPELDRRFRDNYFHYCLALLEFNLKNYESAMELNSKLNYDELYMKLNSKILQLQIFYEMGIEDSLISALESFRHFLVNNKLIPNERRMYYSNFHKILSKIVSLSDKRNKTDLEIVKRQLSDDSKIINKSWLLDKIDDALK